MRAEIKKRTRRKKRLKVFLSFFTVILVVLLVYGFQVYSSLSKTVDQMHDPLERTKSDKREEEVSIKNSQPVSFLLLGVDEREGDKGRSDTIIVITVNPLDNSMKMFSIPRDTRTEIIGYGKEDKINHAYAFGGTEMSVRTVENLLDIPIDYYIKVNMEALSEIVDALGGITVNNEIEWTDVDGYYKSGYLFEKGTIELNGPKTIGFVRMRHQDPRGDFGRNQRQQEVIRAIIDKGASLSTFTKIDDVLKVLGDNVTTNLTFEEMKVIQKDYAQARNNMERFELKVDGTMIDGVSYQILSDEERLSLSNNLKSHLGIQ